MNTQTANQIELRWKTPGGRLNPLSFRNAVGFHLGRIAPQRDWTWLFNRDTRQASGNGIAVARFVTGGNAAGTFAAIVVVGPEACAALSDSMLDLLAAVRAVDGIEGHPDVRSGLLWWKPSERPNEFRTTSVVLNAVRGDRAYYDSLRADPSPLRPILAEAVATGLDRMAERIGLPLPGLSAGDVEVVSLGRMSGVPVGPTGRGMRSRLTNAVVRMPLRLEGDWRIGGLLGYGNGGIAETAKERHWRFDDAPAVPHPKFPRIAA